MEDITSETAKFLIAQGALGIICLYLLVRNYMHDRRLAVVTDKIISIAEDNAEALTAIKERVGK